jgi:hypothetical protein
MSSSVLLQTRDLTFMRNDHMLFEDPALAR